jgi:hypothetical protein
MMANDQNAVGAPAYSEFSNAALDKVYDIRALIEAARCRLDAYEHASRDDELVDLDRVLHMAVRELSGLASRIDEKTYAYALKNPLPKVAHVQ